MPASPSWTFVSLGGNLGGAAAVQERLKEAIERIEELSYVTRVERSSFYRTAPLGPVPDQPDFINAVIAFPAPAVDPVDLLRELLAIENALGRERAGAIPKGPRAIDLDLLLMGARRCDEPGPPALVLPHPKLTQRRFVLDPLAELLGAGAELPGLGRLDDLRANVADQRVVRLDRQ